jgi:hypothetical protein
MNLCYASADGTVAVSLDGAVYCREVEKMCRYRLNYKVGHQCGRLTPGEGFHIGCVRWNVVDLCINLLGRQLTEVDKTRDFQSPSFHNSMRNPGKTSKNMEVITKL